MRKNFIMLGMILLVGIIILSIAIKLKPSYSMFSPSSQSYIDNMIVNKMKDEEDTAFLIITHYQRLLNYIKPDYVHVLMDGKIVKSGGPELALKLEKEGYDWLKTK